MKTIIEGIQNAADLRIAIVVSRFNSFVTDKLLEGAYSAYLRSGGHEDRLRVYRVPGACEIPVICKRLLDQGNVDAIVALGAVIRGETAHFEHVSNAGSSGIATLSFHSGIPIANGILTLESMEQAIDRVGGKSGHKGEEAMQSAIQTAQLCRQIS